MATVNLLERRDVTPLLPVSAPEMLSAPESPESVLESLEPAGDPGAEPTLATPPSSVGLGSDGLGKESSVGEAGSAKEGKMAEDNLAEDECSTDDDDGSACDVVGLADDECFFGEVVCVGAAANCSFVVEVVWWVEVVGCGVGDFVVFLVVVGPSSSPSTKLQEAYMTPMPKSPVKYSKSPFVRSS